MREEQGGARLEVRLHLVLPERRLGAVGDEERDELCATHGVGDRLDRQAGFLGRGSGAAVGPQADLDLDA